MGPSRTFLHQLAGDGENGARRFYSCDDCYASRYFLSITPSGYAAPCPLTFCGRDPLDGRKLGFARAFEMLRSPTRPAAAATPPRS